MKTHPRYRIFLSSTFSDLRAERDAVQKVIDGMGDYFVGMEHFGSFAGAPLAKCLEEVRSSDIVVLALGESYGSTPPGENTSFTEHEFKEAKEQNIQLLAYVVDRPAKLPPPGSDPRLEEFRRRLRENQGAPCFTSPNDLALQVAIGISRLIREMAHRVGRELDSSMLDRHQAVVNAIRDGDLQQARRLNREILSVYKDSPRANYNEACLLTLLAEREKNGARVGMKNLPENVKEWLDAARGHLRFAVECGLLKFIAAVVTNDRDREDPVRYILRDGDLRLLFQRHSSLKRDLETGPIRKQHQTTSGGCGC